MDTRAFPSIPSKKLKTDILSTDASFKLRDIIWYTGSDSIDVLLTAAAFGTAASVSGVFEPGTPREEFFTFDPSTITAATTTGVTIVGRGLPKSSDYTTEDSTRKFNHASGSAVLLFTNAPAFYDRFVNKNDDEQITGDMDFVGDVQFSPTAIPIFSSLPTLTDQKQVATKDYADQLAIAGAPNATTTVQGLLELATQAENDAGTATGATGASLAATPTLTAKSIQDAKWTFGVDAGGTDDYAITLVPAVTAYAAGQSFTFDANTANTGAATLNVNTLGAKTIKKSHDQDLETGDIEAGSIVTVIYDGTNFQLQTPQATAISTAVATSAEAFFATTSRQALKFTGVAGHDLAAGEVVAIESDGLMYRTRPTGISSTNVGAATNFATTELGSQGKMHWFDTTNERIKCFLGQDNAAAPDSFNATRVTVDSGFETISSSAVALPVFGSAVGAQDAVQHNSNTQVTIATRIATGELQVVSFDGITSTPSFGAIVTLEASANGAAITDTSSAGVLVAFTGISATELRSYKVTFSGTTLTESTNASLLSGSNLLPLAAGRFVGTDFIAVAYINTVSGALNLIIGEYNPAAGTWTSIGSAVEIESSGFGGSEQVFITPISATKVAVGYIRSVNLKAVVITRSGTVASVGSALTVISGGGTTTCATFKKIGVYSFFAGIETNAGGKLQIIALDRDMTAFSNVGSVLVNETTSDQGIAGCLLRPDRWIAMYQDTGSTTKVQVRELTTTVASAIGLIEAAVAASGTEEVIMDGYISGLASLTAGVPYYTGIDGQLVTSAAGTGVKQTTDVGTAGAVRRALVATSATEGIVTL